MARSRSERMDAFENETGFAAPMVDPHVAVERWVPAAYLLPEEGCPVLVQIEGAHHVIVARLNLEDGRWREVGSTTIGFRVGRRDEWTRIPIHQTMTREEARARRGEERARRDRLRERKAA